MSLGVRIGSLDSFLKKYQNQLHLRLLSSILVRRSQELVFSRDVIRTFLCTIKNDG
jgi:hypothetical protein